MHIHTYKTQPKANIHHRIFMDAILFKGSNLKNKTVFSPICN